MKKEIYLKLRQDHSFEINPARLLQHIATDLVLIGSAIFLCRQGVGINLFAIPLFASFMFRSFSLMHEAVHGLVSKNKRINNLVGLIYGAFSALPFEPWKKSHLDHHYWSGNYQKDPVMALITILPKWSDKSIRVLNFLWQSWIPVLAFLQYVVFWVLSIKTTLASRKTPYSLSQIVVPLAFFGFMLSYLSASTLLQVIIPSIVLYLMAVDVVNLPHHLQLPMISGDQKLPPWEQHAIARTCLYPTWVAKWIVLNFNYHSEHHMYPDAPWYVLDSLHKAVQLHLGDTQHTDPSFKWIIENRPKSLLVVISPNENVQKAKIVPIKKVS